MKKKIKFLKAFGGKAIGDVVEMDAADANSLIEAKIAEAVSEQTEDPVEKAIGEYLQKFQTSLVGVVEKTTEQIIKACNKADGRGLKILGASIRNDDDQFFGYSPDAPLGEFAKDVRLASSKGGAGLPERLAKVYEVQGKATSGMNEAGGEDGGFLVPTTMGAGIYERIFAEENLLSRTDNYNVAGNSIEFNGLIDDSRATGSRGGGVRGYWLDEGDQYTGSRPKFHKIRVNVSKLGVLCYATDELLEDSNIALEQFLTKRAASEINFLTSDAIINGNGVAKPLGIMLSAALITKTRTTANKVLAADIMNMWNGCFAASRSNAVWLINQEVEPQLDQLYIPVKNVAGTENVGGLPVYLPPGGLNDKPWATLKGRPVLAVEWCAALGTSGDIILADLSQYLSCTKGAIKSSVSIHLRFDYDETAFKFTYRVGGQPWWSKKVTPYKGSGNYSPFLALS